jgi:integrase
MNNIEYVGFANEWIEYHRQFIKESTYANYRNIIDNHLLVDFANSTLDNFTSKQLQQYVLTKINCGSVKNMSLSIKTVKDIMVVLKLSIRYAFSHELISSFDLSVKYPKTVTNSQVMIISNRDIKKIVKTTNTSINIKDIGILIGLLTGLRIGEICALKYSDICFKSNTITISRTLQRIYTKKNKTRIMESTPKTNSSYRSIPLSQELKSLLQIHKREGNNYILSNSQSPVEPRLLRKRFNYILIKNKIKHYKFHSLRHTFATKCIEAKIDYKTISVLLGHSNVNTTLNLYVHPNNSQKKKAINKLTAHILK